MLPEIILTVIVAVILYKIPQIRNMIAPQQAAVQADTKTAATA